MMRWKAVGPATVGLTLAMGMGCQAGFETEESTIGTLEQQIVGGNDADKGEYPWQVKIERKEGGSWAHHCGGSLIAPNWILSASHCFFVGKDPEDPYDAGVFRFVLGAHDYDSFDGDEQVFSVDLGNVAAIYTHDDYDNVSVNDVALVELSENAELNDYVQVVRLARGGDEALQTAWASGFGNTGGGNDIPPEVLQEVSLTIQESSVCDNYFGGVPREITDTDLCTTNYPGDPFPPMNGTCHGDSGGPLVVQRASGCWEQVGVTNFGRPSCDGSHSVFARVTSWMSWIEERVPNIAGDASYQAEADMDHTAGGSYTGGWNLHSNGYSYFTHSFEAGASTLLVRASGREGWGWPNMRVTVGGQEVFNQQVTSVDWQDYPMTVNRTSAGSAEVRIYFTNDLYRPEFDIDRNLHIDKATILGETACDTVAGNLTTSFNRESIWDEGYCARITMTNPAGAPTTSWTAHVDAGTGTVFKYWTPETLTDSSTVSFPSEDWNRVIAPGGSYGTAGFCVNHAPGAYVPPVISVNAVY